MLRGAPRMRLEMAWGVGYDRAVLRRLPLIVGLAAALALGSAGPALAAQPYLLNFNNVDFSSGTIDGLVNTNGTLTLAPGELPTFDYVDPHASVPVLGD